jgi:hypothetical protein
MTLGIPQCPKCLKPVESFEIDYRRNDQIISTGFTPEMFVIPGLPHWKVTCHGFTWEWDGPLSRCAEMYEYFQSFTAP